MEARLLLSEPYSSAYLASTPELLNVAREKYLTIKIHIQQLQATLSAFQQFCFPTIPVPFLTLS